MSKKVKRSGAIRVEKSELNLSVEQKLKDLWLLLNRVDGYDFHEQKQSFLEKFSALFPEVTDKTKLPYDDTKDFGLRTNTIIFTRQLRPQPPPDAHPDWYYINTLGFFKNGKKVWEQEIPEADSYFTDDRTFKWLNVPRYYPSGCSVFFDSHWGWMLRFEMSHAEAAKIWAVLFKDNPEVRSQYDREKGQCFELREWFKEVCSCGWSSEPQEGMPFGPGGTLSCPECEKAKRDPGLEMSYGHVSVVKLDPVTKQPKETVS